MKYCSFILLGFILFLSACEGNKKDQAKEKENMFTGKANEVKLMTLDPGHFHAALVQKNMYKEVDPTVYVFAPEGPDVAAHLQLIERYNNRSKSPTEWEEKVYTGPDFMEKMLSEKPGNVMVTSGNNAKKTEYIAKTIDAGINVLADKPMVISPEDFPMLEKAFEVAEEKQVLLYDIMTERYEITTILQRELSMIPEVFGTLQKGTTDDPAITKESVHHFFKYVSGSPLTRPAWFFDTEQQGEGIVDVNTHLVDLIQWEAFPEVTLTKDDVNIISAKRWTTDLTPEMFEKVTKKEEFPEYLQKDVQDGVLKVYSNGEINYTLKGIHAKASVIWNFQAPEGAKDTHYSIMRGTKSNLIIRQGKEQDYQTTLYVEADIDITNELKSAIEKLAKKYEGLSVNKIKEGQWMIDIPAKHKVGHEAHFSQVTEKYLDFLENGNMPAWEVPNMIVKYYTTTKALEMAR